MVEAGHGDAGGEDAHAGARHHVDLVSPQVVVQTWILPISKYSNVFSMLLKAKLNFYSGFMKVFLL